MTTIWWFIDSLQNRLC